MASSKRFIEYKTMPVSVLMTVESGSSSSARLASASASSTDGATFVAMFLTPKTVCAPVLDDKGVAQSAQQCGYLDFARAIVEQTVTNLAGANAAQANAFLAKGDTFRAAKDYKQAYQNYRLAYKTAAGISTR